MNRVFDVDAPDRLWVMDDAVAESFFGTLQLELLDQHRWESRATAA